MCGVGSLPRARVAQQVGLSASGAALLWVKRAVTAVSLIHMSNGLMRCCCCECHDKQLNFWSTALFLNGCPFVLLCCAVPCRAVPCCAVLCCAVLCCAVLCCAVLCCAVLCCAAQRVLFHCCCMLKHRLYAQPKTQVGWDCILELRSRSAYRAVSIKQSFASTLVTTTAPHCLGFSQPHSLSTMRNLALRLRGFICTSSSPALGTTTVTQ